VKPEYQEAIERIDADRKRWMKTELMVDCQISGGMAETLIDEYFGKRENAPAFWIAKSRLEKVLSGEIGWPHVYTTDQSEHFECVPLFISTQPPAPAPHVTGIELAARFVEKRLKDYVDEFGSTDPETGTVEFPGNGDEYVGELEEIVEGIRALGTNHGCKSDLHPEYVTPAGDA